MCERGGREKMERRHSIYAMLEGGDNGCGKIGSARRSADVSAHRSPVCGGGDGVCVRGGTEVVVSKEKHTNSASTATRRRKTLHNSARAHCRSVSRART